MARRIALAGALALAGCSRPPVETPAPRPVPTTASTTSTTTPTTVPPSTTLPVAAVPPGTAAGTVPPPAPGPPPVERAAGPPPDDVWLALSRCESGHTNLAGPRYWGYHSWLLDTWSRAGGTGRPNDHSYEAQVIVAKAWLARTSWSQWPACSRRLGLR
jgi:resuscitation-promoting factor RpfB